MAAARPDRPDSLGSVVSIQVKKSSANGRLRSCRTWQRSSGGRLGGREWARADYDGWFISPEITFTRPFWPFGLRLEKSVTFRYAGLFLDGFTGRGDGGAAYHPGPGYPTASAS